MTFRTVARRRRGRLRRVLRALGLAAGGAALVVAVLVLALRVVNPPGTFYQLSERWRLGAIRSDWVALAALPAHVPLSAMAAEDAGFCLHWGFEPEVIREVWEGGALRGASTISQQTAKNVFLWQGRSWLRKGLEAGFALAIEAGWGKRRIMEIYLNVVEFDEGVFGVGAAAGHYFGVEAAALSPAQAARLMAVLPDPKGRSAARPGRFTRARARAIADGARLLATDGRGACLL